MRELGLGIDTIHSRDTENMDSIIQSSKIDDDDLQAFTRAAEKAQRIYLNRDLEHDPSQYTLGPNQAEILHNMDALTSVQSVTDSNVESYHYAPYGLDKSKLAFGAKLLAFGNTLKV